MNEYKYTEKQWRTIIKFVIYNGRWVMMDSERGMYFLKEFVVIVNNKNPTCFKVYSDNGYFKTLRKRSKNL